MSETKSNQSWKPGDFSKPRIFTLSGEEILAGSFLLGLAAGLTLLGVLVFPPVAIGLAILITAVSGGGIEFIPALPGAFKLTIGLLALPFEIIYNIAVALLPKDAAQSLNEFSEDVVQSVSQFSQSFFGSEEENRGQNLNSDPDTPTNSII